MGLSTEEENEAYTLSKDEGAVAKAVQEFASLETTTDADRSLLTALLASHSSLRESIANETDLVDTKKEQGEVASSAFAKRLQALKRCRTEAELNAWKANVSGSKRLSAEPSSAATGAAPDASAGQDDGEPAKKAKTSDNVPHDADVAGNASVGRAFLERLGLQPLLTEQEATARRREDLEAAGERCFKADDKVVLVKL